MEHYTLLGVHCSPNLTGGDVLILQNPSLSICKFPIIVSQDWDSASLLSKTGELFLPNLPRDFCSLMASIASKLLLIPFCFWIFLLSANCRSG